MDPGVLSTEEIIALYRKRWGVGVLAPQGPFVLLAHRAVPNRPALQNSKPVRAGSLRAVDHVQPDPLARRAGGTSSRAQSAGDQLCRHAPGDPGGRAGNASSPSRKLPKLYAKLLQDIAECVLSRRRPRVYRRVVKTQRSKLPMKHWNDYEIRRDFEDEVLIQRASA
jgi:hypothetical protein